MVLVPSKKSSEMPGCNPASTTATNQSHSRIHIDNWSLKMAGSFAVAAVCQTLLNLHACKPVLLVCLAFIPVPPLKF